MVDLSQDYFSTVLGLTWFYLGLGTIFKTRLNFPWKPCIYGDTVSIKVESTSIDEKETEFTL